MPRLLRLSGHVEPTSAGGCHCGAPRRRASGGQRRLAHPLPLQLLWGRLDVELGPALPPASATVFHPVPFVFPRAEADDMRRSMAIAIAIAIAIPASSAASPRRTAAAIPRWRRTSVGWPSSSSNAGDGLVATRRGRRRLRRAYRSTAIGAVAAGHPGGLVRYTSSSSAHCCFVPYLLTCRLGSYPLSMMSRRNYFRTELKSKGRMGFNGMAWKSSNMRWTIIARTG